jgi:hypothetical protein
MEHRTAGQMEHWTLGQTVLKVTRRGSAVRPSCNLMYRWMEVWTFRRKGLLHLQRPNSLRTLNCLLVEPLRKDDSHSANDPSKISQKVRIFVMTILDTNWTDILSVCLSVQTAGAPFGQNIASRGGAEFGDIWEKIESAVQCNAM